MILWVCLMLIGFVGSALYSGLETGAYTLNRVRLQVLHHRGNRQALRLRRLMDRPTVLLMTLLIGNNLTNQLGTASLTTILEKQGFNTLGILLGSTLIVTPILFVFGETLPKDLFAAHSDRWMYRLSPALDFSRRVFTYTGLVPIVGLFTSGLMRVLGTRDGAAVLHPRRRVEALVREGVGYGLLSDEQSAIVQRVFDLSSRTVRDEMVPWRDVITVRRDVRPEQLWELAWREGRSRFPVVDGQGKVTGVLKIDEALIHDRDHCPPVDQLCEPARFLPVDEPWRAALARMQRDHVGLAIVTHPNGRPVGIVTIKDLIEPITGELVRW